MAKSSTNCNVRLEKSSRSENSYDDVPASCGPVLAASKRPEQLELHQEVKVGPPGTIPPERGLLELHQEVKVGPPGTIPRETGGKVEWCTECVKKGYTPHRCCDDVQGISRGPHRQAFW